MDVMEQLQRQERTITWLKQLVVDLNDKLELVLEKVPTAIAFFDENQCCQMASRQWLKEFGLSEVIGKDYLQLFKDHPEPWKTVFTQSLSGTSSKNECGKLPRVDGSQDWMKWETHPWKKVIEDSAPTGSQWGQMATAGSSNNAQKLSSSASTSSSFSSTNSANAVVAVTLSQQLPYLGGPTLVGSNLQNQQQPAYHPQTQTQTQTPPMMGIMGSPFSTQSDVSMYNHPSSSPATPSSFYSQAYNQQLSMPPPYTPDYYGQNYGMTQMVPQHMNAQMPQQQQMQQFGGYGQQNQQQIQQQQIQQQQQQFPYGQAQAGPQGGSFPLVMINNNIGTNGERINPAQQFDPSYSARPGAYDPHSNNYQDNLTGFKRHRPEYDEFQKPYQPQAPSVYDQSVPASQKELSLNDLGSLSYSPSLPRKDAGFVMFVENINTLKQANIQFKSMETYHRLVTNQFPMHVAQLDQKGKYWFCNTNTDVLGFTPEELQHTNFANVVHTAKIAKQFPEMRLTGSSERDLPLILTYVLRNESIHVPDCDFFHKDGELISGQLYLSSIQYTIEGASHSSFLVLVGPKFVSGSEPKDLTIPDDAFEEDLLFLKRLTSDRISVNARQFHLPTLLSKLVDVSSMKVNANENLDLIVDIPSKFHQYLVGDEDLILNCLANLVDNALNHTDRGHVIVRIRAPFDIDEMKSLFRQSIGQSNSEAAMTYFTVRFEVIDTGKGFSETKVKKILNSKDVAMPTDHTKGIGLFICRKLVDLMGGSIGARLAASSDSLSPLSSAPSLISHSPTLFFSSSSSSSSFNALQPRSTLEGSIFWIDLPLAFSNPITSTSTTLPPPSSTPSQDATGQKRPETTSTVAPIRVLKDSVVTSVVKTSSVTVDESQILQLYSTFNTVGSGQKVLVAHSDPDVLKILVSILEGSLFVPIPVRSDKEAMDAVKMDIAQHFRSKSSSSSSSLVNLTSSGSVIVTSSSSPISVASPHTQISIASTSTTTSPSSTPSPHDFRRVDSEAPTLHEDLTSPETIRGPQEAEINNGSTGTNSSSLGGSGGNSKANHITLAILDKGHLSYLLGQQIKESYEAHQMLTPIIALMVPSSQNLPLEALSKFGIDAIIPKPINNSTFSTLLKNLVDRHRDHQKSHLDVVRAKSSTPKFNIKVLVAEDNLVNQKVITRRLESYGCTYDVVENGERCCQKLEGPVSPYDLVLMDVEMPLLDGFQATAIIRKRNVVAMTERGSRPIPIIALTANVDISGLESCNAVGMSGFLAKPLRNEKLEQELKRWFNPSYDPLPPPS